MLPAGMFLSSPAFAQAPAASSYPVDPAASAGMTTGTPSTTTARQVQMMQVRNAAQSAQGDAVAASMSRAADRTIQQQNEERVLQNAREEKAIKRAMAERAKWDRMASTQVNKVSANDMSSWNSNGGVRVQRNVPDPFITALIEEERQLAAQEAAAAQREPGFGPFGKVKLNPFKRREADVHVDGLVEALMDAEPQPSSVQTVPAPSGYDPNVDVPSDGGGGFFNKFRPGKREDAPIDASAAEPQFVQTSSSRRSAPASAPVQPGTVPRISGAELVDGSSPVNSASINRGSQAAAPAPQPASFSFAEEMPSDSGERGGFFSKLKSNEPSGSDSGGGGGLFSFGKKKDSQPDPGIDASLFPAGSVAAPPTGGSLGGGYTAADVAEDTTAAPSSTGYVQLPGMEEEKRSGGFSFPTPKIKIPTPSGGGGGGNVPTMTTVNSSGNSYYVVTDTAQIMIFGESQMQSEVRALPAGMVVLMTKPGDSWASVRLSNGTEGIVQNKFLRPASSSEIGAQFAPSN